MGFDAAGAGFSENLLGQSRYPGVIVEVHGKGEMVSDVAGQGRFRKIEIVVRFAGVGVHPSGDADAHAQNFLFGDTRPAEGIAKEGDDAVEACGGVFQYKGLVFIAEDLFHAQVEYREGNPPEEDDHADAIGIGGIHLVEKRTTAAFGFPFAGFDEESSICF